MGIKKKQHSGVKLNPVLPLIMALGSPSMRQDVRRVLEDVDIPPPYDTVIHEILKRKGKMSGQDLVGLSRIYLPAQDIAQIGNMDVISVDLGMQYLEELISIRNLEKIEGYLKQDAPPDQILNKIKETSAIGLSLMQQPKAKRFGSLDRTEEEYMFEWMRYRWAKQKIYVICAYPGIGKTTMCLILAKAASELGLNVLYISIADWSESSLYYKIQKVKKSLDIWYAIYNECSVYQIESEIRKVKPDVVIVDSIKAVTNYYADEERMYIELGNRAKVLRLLAGDYNTCMVTTHQLVVMEELVRPQHLLGAKAHLLEHVDLALGVGTDDPHKKDRVISTLKVRNSEAVSPFVISLDHNQLTYNDMGKYMPPKEQSARIRV